MNVSADRYWIDSSRSANSDHSGVSAAPAKTPMKLYNSLGPNPRLVRMGGSRLVGGLISSWMRATSPNQSFVRNWCPIPVLLLFLPKPLATALGGGLALCYAVTPQPIKLPMGWQGRRAGFYASIGSK